MMGERARVLNSPAAAIRVEGVVGLAGAAANGVFYQSAEEKNGKPVYLKQGDAATCCWYGADKVWSVSPTSSKDHDLGDGWLHAVGAGHVSPDAANNGWMAASRHRKAGWDLQRAVVVTPVQDSELVAGTALGAGSVEIRKPLP